MRKIKTKNFRQSVTFNTSPSEIYDALMDSKKHSRFTGARAKISRKVGGSFTAHGGYCSGVNLELQEGKKIVQSWRGNDWPKNHYSTITFELSTALKGTRLKFTQTGVPEKHLAHIKSGWKEHYWQPIKAMLE